MLAPTEDFPFAHSGVAVQKDTVIKAVMEVAKVSGLQTRDEDGKCVRAGHVFRIESARHLRRDGASVPAILCVARWNNQVAARHLRYSPLEHITPEYVTGKAASSSAQEVAKGVNGFGNQTMKPLAVLNAKAETHHADILELIANLTVDDSVTDPRYIVSDKYMKWHIALPMVKLPTKHTY